MILITDRRDMSQRLYDAIVAIEPCVRLRLREVPDRQGGHALLICDVDLTTAESLAATKAALRRCSSVPLIPILYLSRDDGEPAYAKAQEIGATMVLPDIAPHGQVVFMVRRLIEASLQRGEATPDDRPAAFATSMRAASTVFTDILKATNRGRPVSKEDLRRGSDAIIAAVGGGRIGLWLAVVQAYDDLTHQHSLLVAGLATAFTMHLGLSPGGQQLIAQAALLHDIGKVMLPRHVINKPGRLTADEMDLVRRHPGIGHQMLVEQGGFDPRELDIVRHHHEMIDGSGYPDGLRGEVISPLVRLTTICDIYAALIERRSYKEPMPSKEALAIIGKMAGKLDASLVAAFDDFVRRTSSALLQGSVRGT